MIVTISYKFQLNGQNYKSIGSDIADTKKETDILEWSVEEIKVDAICDALFLSIDDFQIEDLFNAKFEALSITCGDTERDII